MEAFTRKHKPQPRHRNDSEMALNLHVDDALNLHVDDAILQCLSSPIASC